jgi:hypothetical protein
VLSHATEKLEVASKHASTFCSRFSFMNITTPSRMHSPRRADWRDSPSGRASTLVL